MDYIPTPFYKTTPESRLNIGEVRHPSSTCSRFPQANYRPYQLFALRTRLQPLVNKRYSSDQPGVAAYIVRYDTKMLNNKLTVVIKLLDGDEYLKMKAEDYTYFQRAVDWLTGNEPDVALLISNSTIFMSNLLADTGKSLISDCWSQGIMKYLAFSPNIRPHTRKSGRFQVAGLYVDLSRMADYRGAYNKLYMDSAKRIDYMYQDGYISLPVGFDPKRLAKWQVSAAGPKQPLYSFEINDTMRPVLFRAMWKDNRLTKPVGGLVPFLQKHLIEDSNRVLIDIGSDGIIRRHQVAKTFKGYFTVEDYVFKYNFVEIRADNLARAQLAASLVQRSTSMPVGKVITMRNTHPNIFNTYLAMFPSGNTSLKIDMIGYVVSGGQYNLSCQIPYEANPTYYYKALTRWYEAEINGQVVEPLIKSSPALETKLSISEPPLISIPIKPLYLNAKIERPLISTPPSIIKPRPIIQMPNLNALGSILNTVGIPSFGPTAIAA
jgi:hypothetical protein